jgi:hypothetical protein
VESTNWYIPGLSGISERIDLNFASAVINAGKYYAKIMNAAIQQAEEVYGCLI